MLTLEISCRSDSLSACYVTFRFQISNLLSRGAGAVGWGWLQAGSAKQDGTGPAADCRAATNPSHPAPPRPGQPRTSAGNLIAWRGAARRGGAGRGHGGAGRGGAAASEWMQQSDTEGRKEEGRTSGGGGVGAPAAHCEQKDKRHGSVSSDARGRTSRAERARIREKELSAVVLPGPDSPRQQLEDAAPGPSGRTANCQAEGWAEGRASTPSAQRGPRAGLGRGPGGVRAGPGWGSGGVKPGPNGPVCRAGPPAPRAPRSTGPDPAWLPGLLEDPWGRTERAGRGGVERDGKQAGQQPLSSAEGWNCRRREFMVLCPVCMMVVAARLELAGAGWSGLERAGAGWSGLERAGAGWSGLELAGAGWREGAEVRCSWMTRDGESWSGLKWERGLERA
ncbi:hypothetical protein FOCC_FOCC006091, partial [Frankliniella occidentalis]